MCGTRRWRLGNGCTAISLRLRLQPNYAIIVYCRIQMPREGAHVVATFPPGRCRRVTSVTVGATAYMRGSTADSWCISTSRPARPKER